MPVRTRAPSLTPIKARPAWGCEISRCWSGRLLGRVLTKDIQYPSGTCVGFAQLPAVCDLTSAISIRKHTAGVATQGAARAVWGHPASRGTPVGVWWLLWLICEMAGTPMRFSPPGSRFLSKTASPQGPCSDYIYHYICSGPPKTKTPPRISASPSGPVLPATSAKNAAGRVHRAGVPGARARCAPPLSGRRSPTPCPCLR